MRKGKEYWQTFIKAKKSWEEKDKEPTLEIASLKWPMRYGDTIFAGR